MKTVIAVIANDRNEKRQPERT